MAEYESLVLDDDTLSELLNNFKSAATGIAKIIQSADSDGNEELSEAELVVGLLNLILEIANNHSDDETETPIDQVGSGYTFTGIQKGTTKLDLTQLWNRINKKSNIGHTHTASAITTGQLSVNRIEGVENGVWTNPVSTSGVINRRHDSANITASAVTSSTTGSTVWNNVESDQTLDFQTIDSQSNMVGAFRTGIQADGTTYGGIYSQNYWQGSFKQNYIYAGISKTTSGMTNTYAVADVDAFYKGIQPQPAHMGICSGSHSLTTGSSYYTDSGTISFPLSSSSNGLYYSSAPNVIVSIEYSGDGNQTNATALAGITPVVRDVTTSSFSIRVFNANQTSGVSLTLKWIAIGSYSYNS